MEICDRFCQVPTDPCQHLFSRRGENKIRGSAGNQEENDAKDNQGGPPERGTTAILARGFRERRIEHERRVGVRRRREGLSPNFFPGVLFLPVLPGKSCRFPRRKRPFHLRRCRLFPPGKGYGRFGITIVGRVCIVCRFPFLGGPPGVQHIKGIPASSAPNPYPFGPLEPCTIHVVARMAFIAIDLHGQVPPLTRSGKLRTCLICNINTVIAGNISHQLSKKFLSSWQLMGNYVDIMGKYFPSVSVFPVTRADGGKSGTFRPLRRLFRWILSPPARSFRAPPTTR